MLLFHPDPRTPERGKGGGEGSDPPQVPTWHSLVWPARPNLQREVGSSGPDHPQPHIHNRSGGSPRARGGG